MVNRYSSEKDETPDKDPTIEKNPKILVAYPNLGLLSPDKKRCLVIHHGHFIESKYRLMSTLKAVMLESEKEMPEDIQELEAENFAWIDFLWSAIGRSGDVGEEVETLYEHMHNSEHMKKYISEMARKFAKRYDIPYVPDEFMEKKVLKIALNQAYEQFSKRERGVKAVSISKETEEGLSLYLKTTWEQIKEERDGWTPSELAFVFGHTHKPYEKNVPIDWLERDIPVYNSGGWVVDTVNPYPVFGGSVILMDKELNLVSLRMYNDGIVPEAYRVEVKKVDEKGRDNPFYERISDLVNYEEEPWKQFSSEALRAMQERKKRLKNRFIHTQNR
ncbi:hypothetical protein ACT9XH_09285 [Methanococcoides methylutens]|uniref:hypothetical protein n=1 Tax=Methanococcoides methylutens TaxID=2226 RepID=UPI004044E821